MKETRSVKLVAFGREPVIEEECSSYCSGERKRVTVAVCLDNNGNIADRVTLPNGQVAFRWGSTFQLGIATVVWDRGVLQSNRVVLFRPIDFDRNKITFHKSIGGISQEYKNKVSNVLTQYAQTKLQGGV